MAIISTGVTAMWGMTYFEEMFDISVPLFGGMRKDRSLDATTTGWTDEVGQIQISTFGTANMDRAEYGKREDIKIGGAGIDLTRKAVCIGVSWTPELNGVTRYTFTAQLLDE